MTDGAHEVSHATRVGPVSAVVVTYEAEDFLPGCLDALLAQEGGLDEILVVDNASSDGSLALLAARYPEVRVLSMGENAGPARARNAGMRAARNSWVLAVDVDAVPRPDVLARLRAVADGDPDVALVQPRSVFGSDEQRVHYDGGAFHYAGLIALRNFYVPLDQAQGRGVVEVDVAIAVCLLVDARVVLELGGYDESFFILFEDLDLSWRLRLAGRRIVSDEDAIVVHRSGTPGVSFRQGSDYPSRRVLFHSRNRWLFLLKAYRWRTLFVAAPGLCVYELVWLAFAVVQGGFLAWCRGKLQVLGQLGSLRARRRAVQADRRVRDRELLTPGPLTLTPGLKAGAVSGRLARGLDAVLALWWRLVRRLAG